MKATNTHVMYVQSNLYKGIIEEHTKTVFMKQIYRCDIRNKQFTKKENLRTNKDSVHEAKNTDVMYVTNSLHKRIV